MSISLRTLIDKRNVNTRVMALLQQRAVAAIIEARENGETGTVTENSFIFSSVIFSFAPFDGSHSL